MSRNTKAVMSALLVPVGCAVMLWLNPVVAAVKPDVVGALLVILVAGVCVGMPSALLAYMMATGGGRRRKRN